MEALEPAIEPLEPALEALEGNIESLGPAIWVPRGKP